MNDSRPTPSLWQEFLSGLLRDCFSYYPDNVDQIRYPAEPSAWDFLRRTLLSLAAKAGFYKRRFSYGSAEAELRHIISHAIRYERAWRGLADEESRRLFIQLLRFRVLGNEHVRLPLSCPEYHRERDSVSRWITGSGKAISPVTKQKLDRFEIPFGGDIIRAELTSNAVFHSFVHKQYELHRVPRIAAEPGDYAIDAGGCWGDTSLYFASLVGPEGKVFCFEFEPGNLAILHRNFAANPSLAGRIEIVQHAVGDQSDQEFSYNACGPSTQLQASESGPSTVRTLTIDDLVARRNLPRVDFIKMDIECAELPALHGARATLERFRPKLAISVYHRPEDFFVIQEFLESLNLGYRFFLDHSTIHREETVLFCFAPRPSAETGLAAAAPSTAA